MTSWILCSMIGCWVFESIDLLSWLLAQNCHGALGHMMWVRSEHCWKPRQNSQVTWNMIQNDVCFVPTWKVANKSSSKQAPFNLTLNVVHGKCIYQLHLVQMTTFWHFKVPFKDRHFKVPFRDSLIHKFYLLPSFYPQNVKYRVLSDRWSFDRWVSKSRFSSSINHLKFG